jgi:hypothetical protein
LTVAQLQLVRGFHKREGIRARGRNHPRLNRIARDENTRYPEDRP